MRSKQNQQDISRDFDTLRSIFEGVYHEVFNSLDPTESKSFIYLKTSADRLVKDFENVFMHCQQLEWIPIDAKQPVEYLDVKLAEQYENQPF